MMHEKPDDIPQDVWGATEARLDAAWREHDEQFSPASNSISDGLWDRLIAASCGAILVERERCADVAVASMQAFALSGASEGEIWIARKIADDIRKGAAA